jgi:hypothetical protein
VECGRWEVEGGMWEVDFKPQGTKRRLKEELRVLCAMPYALCSTPKYGGDRGATVVVALPCHGVASVSGEDG